MSHVSGVELACILNLPSEGGRAMIENLARKATFPTWKARRPALLPTGNRRMTLRRPQDSLRLTCPSCEQKLDASGVPAFEEIECPNCSCNFAVPYRFGQYLLEEAISETRFAGVYRARDLKLKREVAVKILFEELAGNIDIIELFLGAARRTAILNDVYIVPIFSCDCHQGLPYIVMEYMHGRCLYHRLSNLDEVLPVGDCVSYCEQAARGLDAAHREGVCHDGLRPTNLLWDGSSKVKITDFGMHEFKRACAQELDLDWRSFLPTGYASPEILLGESDGGLACDVFGLGTTLYHLLTGRRPFSNTVESRMAHLDIAPPRPRELRPDVPEELDAYVMRMIAYEPAARPHGYRELISALFNIREGLLHPSAASSGPAAGAKPRHRLTGGAAAARLVSRSRPSRQRRPRAGILNILLFAAIIAILVLAGYALFRRNGAVFGAFTGRGGGTEVNEGPGNPDHVGSHEELTFNVPLPYRARPLPPDFDFSPSNEQIRSYLAGLPRRLRSRELARVKMLNQARPHLLQLMRYLPYDGGSGIRLRGGRVINGTIAYCDAEGVSIKAPAGEITHVGWADLSPRQYQAFFEFYIQRREARGSLKSDELVALARDYLMLALICDWLGQNERALPYARKAAKTDEETGKLARELLPYLPIQANVDQPPVSSGER